MHLLDLVGSKPTRSSDERRVLKYVSQPVGSTDFAASEKQRSGNVSRAILDDVRAQAVFEGQ
jgi:hypothetical protein